MTVHRKRWRQTRIRSVMVLTLLTATFAAGYRSGDEKSDDFLFEELMRLIDETIVPDTWETLGASSPVPPYPENLSVLLAADRESNTSESELVIHELHSPSGIGNDDEP